MTENKRFAHKYDGMFHHLLDMSKKNFDTQKIQSIDECVDLLNELYEENEQLKRQLKDITLNWTENHIDFDKDELYIKDNNTEITLKNNNLLISVTLPQIKEHLKFHYIVAGRRLEREYQCFKG